MSRDRQRLAHRDFEDIVDLSSKDQQERLERLDDGLRQDVEELLGADRAAAERDFMGAPALVENADDLRLEAAEAPQAGAIPRAPAPERLGPYRIVEEIGGGGMGTVYAAVRDDDTMDRRVAIKVIRAGAENEDIVRRMWLERRILARLQHPNIARIYDAGSTDSGLPYFVMELTDGLPIDQYCAQRQLGIEDRLRLIRKVCRAVEYANENLVVHRDLKPSNILVTADGEPMLLDFGVAKVLDPEPSSEDLEARTEPWRRRLTLEFASPEQIRGQPVSVGCDVYSLGVLLFLLLTGQVPRTAEKITPWIFDSKEKTAEPPKPSRVVAAAPSTSGPGHGARKLSGDLDSIVLGALQDDPRSRYTSAKDLGDDIDRYLHGFPVRARHGSASYRFGKFLRRNAYKVAAAGVFLALGAALVGSWLYTGAQAIENRARLESENAKRKQIIEMFLGIFEQAGPLVSGGVDLTLREAVDRYLSRSAADRLATQPDVKAELLATLGWIYFDLGDPQAALDHQEESLKLRRNFGHSTVGELESTVGVAAALAELSEFERAASLNSRALARIAKLEPANPELHLKALNHQVSMLCLQDEFEKAEPFSRQALELSRDLAPSTSQDIHFAKIQRARVMGSLGNLTEARSLYSEALATLENDYGPQHPLIAVLHNNLGAADYREKDFEAAVETWSAADRAYRDAFGPDYYERVAPLTNVGKAFQRLGRRQEAEAAYLQAIDVATTSPGLKASNESFYFGRPAVALAGLWLAEGRCQDVLELLEAKASRWKKGRIQRQAVELIEECRSRPATSEKN
ncbi:MAG: serine/threonine-protein kinase [Acidobacteriota bacterium]